jgi:hypothetical protein
MPEGEKKSKKVKKKEQQENEMKSRGKKLDLEI